MKYKLSSSSAFPLVDITLGNSEEIQIESGTMVFHNASIKLSGEMNSNGRGGFTGVLKALGRSMTSGDGFFVAKVKAIGNDAKITLAPATTGTVKELKIGQEQWYLNTGAFLASDGDISYTMGRQKLDRALFGGTGGIFVMKTQGTGTMLISGYGDIVEVELDGSEGLTVDNNHVLAWSEGVSYSIGVASGNFGFKTGEGLVNKFNGRGKLLIQSRNIETLAQAVIPFIPSNN